MQNSELEFDSSEETVESKRLKSRMTTDVPRNSHIKGPSLESLVRNAAVEGTIDSIVRTVVERTTTIRSRAETVAARTATIGSSAESVAAVSATATIGPHAETVVATTATSGRGSSAKTVATATAGSCAKNVAKVTSTATVGSKIVTRLAATVVSKDIVELPDLVESNACSRPNDYAVPGPSGITKKLNDYNISSEKASCVSKVEKPRLRKRAKVKHSYTNSDDDNAEVDDGQTDYIPPNSTKRKHSLDESESKSKLRSKKVCLDKQRADTTCVDGWKSKFYFVFS